MSMIRNSGIALAVASVLALGTSAVSAQNTSSRTALKGVHSPAGEWRSDGQWQHSRRGERDWGYAERRWDPVGGAVYGTGALVGSAIAGTGALVSSAVAGTPYGPYHGPQYGYGAPYASADVSGSYGMAYAWPSCTTDLGYGRYRECDAGATGR